MRFLPLPVVVLGLLLLVLPVLPILLPVLIVLAARDRRRLHAAAEVAPCGRCGRPLGLAAIEAADAASAIIDADTLRRTIHPRVVRRVFARCTSCGADHGWDEQRRTFPLLPSGPRADPMPPS